MSHSVSRHLRLEIEDYDASIRRFIPGYEQMLDAAVTAVLGAGELRRVVDLGSGTGALAERLFERHASVTIEIWDIDTGMIAVARERLHRFAERAVFRQRSFLEPIDPADAVMASLALHHVRELSAKQALYRTIAEVLRPGGVFANADATMPEDEPGRTTIFRAWANHMSAHGIAEEQAWRNFEDWAEEDRYFPLEIEWSSLEQAGLSVECPFTRPPSTLLVGRRAAAGYPRR